MRRSLGLGAAFLLPVAACGYEKEPAVISVSVDCEKSPMHSANAVRVDLSQSVTIVLQDGNDRAEVWNDPYEVQDPGHEMGATDAATLRAGLLDPTTGKYTEPNQIVTLLCNNTEPTSVQGSIGGV